MPLAVFVDFLLQIFIFLTGNQADLRERGEVLVGLRQVVLEEIRRRRCIRGRRDGAG